MEKLELREIAIKDLKVGDKVYNFQEKAYDEIAYIEFPRYLDESKKVYVTWKAYNDGSFKEETKDYSTYLPMNEMCYVLIGELGDDEGITAYVSPRFVEVGSYVYLPQTKEAVKITYIAPKGNNKGEAFPYVTLYWETSEYGEDSISIDALGSLVLHLSKEELLQHKLN